MFPARYFAPRAYAPRYFVKVGATVTVTRFVALTLRARPVLTLEERPSLRLRGRPSLTLEED